MNYVVLLIGIILISATAQTVVTKKWYKSLPILSTYVIVLMLLSLFSLVIYVGQQFPGRFHCIFCRIYAVSYPVGGILVSLFSTVILFELLFHLANGRTSIQKAAIAGCLVAIGFSLVVALRWAHSPKFFAEVFWRATSLSLLMAGVFIWIVKAAFSLTLEKRFAVILSIIALCPFAQTIGGYWKSEVGGFFAQLIWPSFTLILYLALRKGPAAQQQSPILV